MSLPAVQLLSALVFTDGLTPYVRNVNAYYEDESFYIITYGLSGKMKHIGKNPVVAISGEWFTGHGKGDNPGYFRKSENTRIAQKIFALVLVFFYTCDTL